MDRAKRVRGILRDNDVLLAPMAGVTDRSFRLLCKEKGCGLTYTEMVSAKGLHYGGSRERTDELLSIDPKEAPAAVQLFGSDPSIMAEQAAALYEKLGECVALFDINMGCPAHKIVSNGEGSALMKTPELAGRIIRAVCAAVPVPVTVKIRKGWDDDSVNAVSFAKNAQDCGAAAVTVHGRTRAQQYGGVADYGIIAEVKSALAVPVIGNGDVFSPEAYAKIKRETNCDGVMIARGAQGNPWLFAAIAAYKRGETFPAPSTAERAETAIRHARELSATKGDRAAVEMRKHVAWYIKGIPGAAAIRVEVNHCSTVDELETLLTRFVSVVGR